MKPRKFLILKYLEEYDLCCNPGHNIWTIYSLPVQVWFVTSIHELISSIADFELLHELQNVVKLRI